LFFFFLHGLRFVSLRVLVREGGLWAPIAEAFTVISVGGNYYYFFSYFFVLFGMRR
jgi:hypothetical protein